MSRATSSDRGADGFSLIEVLVALAVVAIALSAIGSLIATTVRGMNSLDTRLALIETTRALETALPDRSQLRPGNMTGTIGAHRWRLDVLPFVPGSIAPRDAPSEWVPQTVVIRTESAGGAVLQVDTVRLRRRTGP